MIKWLYFLTLFLAINTQAQIEPPNINFSLDQIQEYKPGNDINLEQLGQKKAVILKNQDNLVLAKLSVTHTRYTFPLFLQTYKNKILDFYVVLPSYFLHDVFHQSIINRIGKQNRYINKDEQSVYFWDNKENINYTYSSACTITCFPIFYSAQLVEINPKPETYKSFLTQVADLEKSPISF